MRNNYILFCFLLLTSLSMVKVQASSLEGKDSTVIICSGAQATVDLGAAVYATNLDNGVWDLVDNSIVVADLATYAAYGDPKFIHRLGGRHFMLTGKTPGLYSFVFTAGENSCMPRGAKMIARLQYVQTAENRAHSVYLCAEGEAVTLHLRTLLDFYVRDSAVFLFDAEYSENLSADGLTLDASPGNETIHLTTDYLAKAIHGKGYFSFQYYNRESPCEDTAVVVVNLVRDYDALSLENASKIFCIEQLKDVAYSLSEMSETTLATGVWDLGAHAGVIDPIDLTSGTFTFVSLPTVAEVLTFTYNYEDCTGDAQTLSFDMIITDNMLSEGYMNVSDSLCKSNYSGGYYNLLTNGFGTYTHANTGNWRVLSKPSGAAFDPAVEANGAIAIASLEVGNYAFEYRTFNTVEACDIGDQVDTLLLTVGDLNPVIVGSEYAQLCVESLDAAVDSIDLKVLYEGLEEVTVIGWTGPSQVSISDGGKVAKSELADLGVGVWEFSMLFTSLGCSSTEHGEASVVIELVSEYDLSDSAVVVCRPEYMASSFNMINLTHQFGGTYTLKEIRDTQGNIVTNIDYLPISPMTTPGAVAGIQESDHAIMQRETLIYVVEFDPENSDCGNRRRTLYITFTDDF